MKLIYAASFKIRYFCHQHMGDLILRDVCVRPKSVASAPTEVVDSDGVSGVGLSMAAFYFLPLPQDSGRPELARYETAGRWRRIFVALNEFSWSPRRAPAFSERLDVDLRVWRWPTALLNSSGWSPASSSRPCRLSCLDTDILYTTACQWGVQVGHWLLCHIAGGLMPDGQLIVF